MILGLGIPRVDGNDSNIRRGRRGPRRRRLRRCSRHRPVVLPLMGDVRVLAFSFGCITSHIPWESVATLDRPGINLFQDLSDDTVRNIMIEIRRARRAGDILNLIPSIHWGDFLCTSQEVVSIIWFEARHGICLPSQTEPDSQNRASHSEKVDGDYCKQCGCCCQGRLHRIAHPSHHSAHRHCRCQAGTGLLAAPTCNQSLFRVLWNLATSSFSHAHIRYGDCFTRQLHQSDREARNIGCAD